MNDVVAGLLIVLVASVLQGSFMVPMSYVKKWQWENSWALFSVLGMIGFNWVLAMVTIPSLLDVYRAAPAAALATPGVFGLCWGVGAVCFGLGVAAAGFALGYAIIMGIVLSFGAFIPMLVQHQEEILSTKGLLVLSSLAVMIVGIAVFGTAGTRKEKEQSEKTGAITKTSTLSIKVALAICIVAGLLSCLTNVGFSLSESLVDLAKEHDVSENWAGNSVWAILFTFGALVNLGYCGYLFTKNKSFSAYREPGLLRNSQCEVVFVGRIPRAPVIVTEREMARFGRKIDPVEVGMNLHCELPRTCSRQSRIHSAEQSFQLLSPLAAM